MSEGRSEAGLSDPAAGRAALAEQGYLADEGLAVGVFLATSLGEPLLLEGEGRADRGCLQPAAARLRGLPAKLDRATGRRP